MMVPMQMRADAALSAIAEDVLEGLTRKPRSLPPWLFYDAAGSALFEQITELPEYYLTRTERAILETGAGEILDQAGHGLTLIELGAGTASKTRILISALLRRQLRATYYPVDVSAAALRIAEETLAREFPALKVRPLVGDYSRGLAALAATPGPKLVLYIGSSIGNWEPDEAGRLLNGVRRALRPGDALLLGTDLVKDPAVLHAAYNDAAGVTAAFNKNLLARINRELGADFDLSAFRHSAVFNPVASRIEMYLISRQEQTVRIPALRMRVRFAPSERIHTENSYKFTPAMVRNILSAGGFCLERTWTDERGWFGVHLARVE
jgi:L-histidine N-alpha-methyltransferase